MSDEYHPIAINFEMEAESIGFVPTRFGDPLGWQFMIEWLTAYVDYKAGPIDDPENPMRHFAEHEARSTAYDFLELLHYVADVKELASIPERHTKIRRATIRRQNEDQEARMMAWCDKMEETQKKQRVERTEEEERERALRRLNQMAERVTGVRVVHD